jgi:hypothetical protein
VISIFTGALIKSRIGTKSCVVRCDNDCLSYNWNNGSALSANCRRGSARNPIQFRPNEQRFCRISRCACGPARRYRCRSGTCNRRRLRLHPRIFSGFSSAWLMLVAVGHASPLVQPANPLHQSHRARSLSPACLTRADIPTSSASVAASSGRLLPESDLAASDLAAQARVEGNAR